jgi:Tfp pilus assembly protein PilX
MVNIVKNRTGFAIVVALLVLTVLALVGSMLAMVAIIDYKSSVNFFNTTRAKYLAEAGIAKAIAEIRFGSSGVTTDQIDAASDTCFTTGYSGTMLQYNSGYSVLAVDCASMINLNGQNTDVRLSRMLKSLNSAITSTLTSLSDTDCDNIASGRPYIAKEQVKLVLTGTASQKEEKYERIEPYVTIFGYVDPSVVDPQDISTPYALQPRSPINVNTASREVLYAVFNGITADHSCPRCGGDGYFYDQDDAHNHLDCPYCDGNGSPSNITGNLTISSAEASGLALWIAGDGTPSNPPHRPYSSWNSFYSSVTGFFNQGTTKSSDQEVVMANANPNTSFSWCRNEGWADELGRVGKYVIDMDKNGVVSSDDKGLRVSTTEFSFNSGGYYSFTSTGTVRNASGAVLARKTISSTAKLFDIIKKTSQADFEAGTLTNLQSYPESRAGGVSSAAYDGQIMFAKKIKTSPNSGSYFRANYYTTMNADAAGGSTVLQTPPNSGSPYGTMPNIASVASRTSRGELVPDGMIVDTYDNVCPQYLPSSNVSSDAGTIEIWFRPMWYANDCMMYKDDCADRKPIRLMSKDTINGESLKYPFLTFVYYSQNYSGTMKSSSLGVQGYGYWTGSGWTYYPNLPEGSNEWPIQFARNYGGSQLFGSWDPGSWHQLVITWQKAENDGKGPPNTNATPPGDYSQKDMVSFFDGAAKTSDPYYYHLPYLNSNSWQYMMVGNEWWQGSGSISHFQRNMLNAVIGSVRIWNSKLSSSDVLSEYGSGIYVNNGTYVSPTITPVSGKSVTWGTINWLQVVPVADESLTMDIKTSGSYTGAWTSSGGGRSINATSPSISYRATFASSAGSSSQPNKELLLTPGFECADTITDWVNDFNNNIYSLTADGTSSPHEGTKFAKNWWDGGKYQDVDVTAGGVYRLTCWTFVPSGGSSSGWGTYVGLRWLKSSGSTLSSLQWDVQGKTRNQWNQVDSGWIVAPANARYARIRFGTWQGGVTPANPTYFDDFSFLEQGATYNVPVLDTPVLEDVSITYMQKVEVLYNKEE